MNDKLFYRIDGRVEWICEHGIGHTMKVPSEHLDDKSWWVHGCDGCCKKMSLEKLEKLIYKNKKIKKEKIKKQEDDEEIVIVRDDYIEVK